MTTKPVRVYIAGPLSKGDLGHNIAQAIRAADRLMALGCAPYVPHLTVYWQIMSAMTGGVKFDDYDHWLRLDFAWLGVSDALLRLPGESKGADMEIDEARRLGIPVFYSMEAVEAWLRSRA